MSYVPGCSFDDPKTCLHEPEKYCCCDALLCRVHWLKNCQRHDREKGYGNFTCPICNTTRKKALYWRTTNFSVGYITL